MVDILRPAATNPSAHRIEMTKNNLLWLGGLLLLLWVVAAVTRVVVGALLHLVWIAGLVLLVAWAYRKLF